MIGATLIGSWIGTVFTLIVYPEMIESSLAFSLGCTWVYSVSRIAKAKGE